MCNRVRGTSGDRGSKHTAIAAVLGMVQVILGLTQRTPGARLVSCIVVITEAGQKALKAILSKIKLTIVLLDLDGSLWRVVKYPTPPVVTCQVPVTLSRLSKRVHLVAYLTGRASVQLRSFGMLIRGILAWCQFGAERWDGTQQNLVPVPSGMARAVPELRDGLASAGLECTIEEKTHAVAGHWAKGTPKEKVEQILTLFKAVADKLGLDYHPGNLVVELSPRGLSKKVSSTAFVRPFVGDEKLSGFVAGWTVDEKAAYRQICESQGALKRGLSLKGDPRLVYIGDSAPDKGVAELFLYLRSLGYHVLFVAVAGYKPLEELADVVVDGPAGALAFLQELEIHSRPWWMRLLRRSHVGLAA